MKRICLFYFTVLSFFALASCGGNSTSSGNKSNKGFNPIWGMWVETPAIGSKHEIMFNDDNTGFVFVEDTLQYETIWNGDTQLNVQYIESGIANGAKIEKKFTISLIGDTLEMKEQIGDGTQQGVKRFERVKE